MTYENTKMKILSAPGSRMGSIDDGDDDVFEEVIAPDIMTSSLNINPVEGEGKTPSPTGYRNYKPPEEVLRLREDEDLLDDLDMIVHKTILLGDSGVGKTSLLVQFDTGKFQSGNFSATVGIGFTVMLIGDSGVGKTCLLIRFRDGMFLSGNFISTVGIDFRNKVINLDGAKVKLQIWDTAGQERFRSVTHAYYRDAHALLLLYDVTSKTSFDNIRAWLGEIREYANDDVVIMLLGNKADCNSDRIVRKEDGVRLAKEYNVPFMETSAKNGLNVDVAFLTIARTLKHRTNGHVEQDAKFNIHDYVRDQANRTAPNCPPCNSA